MLKIHTLLITFLCFNTLLITASEPHLIITDGLLGGRSGTIINLFNKPTRWNTDTLAIHEKPDLGQKRCLEYFKKRINSFSEVAPEKPILIATSQGTATVTRYISEITDSNKQPTAFICEGYAASFNRCIPHVVEKLVPSTKKWLPFKDYWLPHAAPYLPRYKDTWFPLWHYNSAEKQAIDLLALLPKDLLIIIVHCKQDRLTPYEGGVAAYQKLRDTGHDNTYLISVDAELNMIDQNNLDSGHINVLDLETNSEHKALIAILNHHKLPTRYRSNTTINLQDYQPDANNQENKAILKQFEHKEKRVKQFGSFLSFSKFIISLYILYKVSIPLMDYVHRIQSSL